MTCSPERRRPLWRRILRDEFDLVPPAVRAMFDHNGHRYARGTAEVTAGDSWIARLCIALSGFPAPGRDIPVSILILAEGGTDIWYRTFRNRSFASAHLGADHILLERFGALTFVFRLTGARDGVHFDMIETRLLGFALPRRISPRIAATQSEERGRFRFEISIDLPFVGRMVRMIGRLGPACVTPTMPQAAPLATIGAPVAA
jgi:hypothetical protein